MLEKWLLHWEQKGYGQWAIATLEVPKDVIGFGGLIRAFIQNAPATGMMLLVAGAFCVFFQKLNSKESGVSGLLSRFFFASQAAKVFFSFSAQDLNSLVSSARVAFSKSIPLPSETFFE